MFTPDMEDIFQKVRDGSRDFIVQSIPKYTFTEVKGKVALLWKKSATLNVEGKKLI